MPRNGSGTYNLVTGTWYPAVNGVLATSSDWNVFAPDIAAALTQSISSDGQTPMTGNLPMGNNKITGLQNGTANTDAATVGQLYPLIGQTGPIVFRNRVHNGNFQVNQRAVTGSVVLAAGVGGHDRWKAGSGGCTYTFSTTGITTTITISAGTLVQVIEGANVEGGIYCMSWTGTATGKIGGGAFSASGVNSTSQTAGANLSIEFTTGTLTNVQVEPGTTATPFERRPYSFELQLCKRYLPVFISQSTNDQVGTGQNISTTVGLVNVAFDVEARVPVTGVTATGTFVITNVSGAVTGGTVAISVGGTRATLVSLTIGAPNQVAGNATTMQCVTNGGRIIFTGAEL